nr:mycothiol synthase [Corynebacterium lactis]
MNVVELFDDNIDLSQARAILDRATAVDGVEPLGEAFVRGLDDASFGHRHFAVLEGETYLGLAGVAPDAMEMVVDPQHRKRGVGAALLAYIDDEVGERLPIWAHGDIGGAERLAELTGRRVVRELLQMSNGAQGLDGAVRGVGKRDDVEAISLVAARQRWGAAAVDRAWLAVNNEAFAWHPEQGGWSQEQLERARDTDWFDPEGVFFAADLAGGEDRAEAICGFHWTKWHEEIDEPTGEVYVIGLSSRVRGRGLGRWLTNVGLAYLRNKGAQQVILYVEGDNEPAIATYRKVGFEVSRRDVMYGAEG